MPIWVQAALWGLFGGSALLIGAGLAYLVKMPPRVTAGIMAFGCGVLISAVAYDLILEGYNKTNVWPIVIGCLAGAIAYTLANWIVSRGGGEHRKRSNTQQTDADEGGATAIAVGSLLDGIPESLVLGASMLGGGGVSTAVLAAVFLSNLPEGLSSAYGMKKAGRSKTFVLGMWTGIAIVSSIAAGLGAALLGDVSPEVLATVNAVAAGALLTMVAETMIPEAVQKERSLTGLLVVVGLLVAFALSRGAAE